MVIKIEKGYLDSNENFVTTKTFIFSGVDNVSDRHSSPNIKISAPGKSAEDSVAFNLSGLQRFISFDFRLINDGTDKSDGTNTTQVVTIDEQFTYLKDIFLDPSSDVQYRITINNLITQLCMIDDITINLTFNNPNYYKGSIQLSIGSNPLSINTS